MEKIISSSSRWRPQSPEASLRQLEEFVGSIKGLPTAEAHQKIAEERFRRPIVIFKALAIRPFWRDWRKAPPLSMEDDLTIKGEKAIPLNIVKGH